ncbi:hypothetical protein ACF1G3_38550, partial [Streptomyces rochei]|uniref:hypothetical protein n=1 Tax=Streptomyces rochei TaxID=1928 RepID=UPI0036F91E5E
MNCSKKGVLMELTPRLKRRISRDYPGDDGQAVEEILLELVNYLTERGDREDKERIAAAALLRAQGQVDILLKAVLVARR